jgi:hypothetical protein
MESYIRKRFAKKTGQEIGIWFVEFCIIPLLPLVVAIYISFYIGLSHNIDIELINPTLLSFPMLMLGFNVIFQTRNFRENSSQAVCYFCLIEILFFSIIFVLSIFDYDSILLNYETIVKMINIPNISQIQSDHIDYLIRNIADTNTRMNLLRWSAFILAPIVILIMLSIQAYCEERRFIDGNL